MAHPLTTHNPHVGIVDWASPWSYPASSTPSSASPDSMGATTGHYTRSTYTSCQLRRLKPSDPGCPISTADPGGSNSRHREPGVRSQSNGGRASADKEAVREACTSTTSPKATWIFSTRKRKRFFRTGRLLPLGH